MTTREEDDIEPTSARVDNRVTIRVGDVHKLVSDLLGEPITRDSVDRLVQVLNVLDHLLAIGLVGIGPGRGTVEDVMGEALPGVAVGGLHPDGAVAAADERDVAPDHAILPRELEPGGQQMCVSIEIVLRTADDAALEAGVERDEDGAAGRDDDVLQGDIVAAVLVGKEVSCHRVLVRQNDARAAGVGIAAGDGGLGWAGGYRTSETRRQDALGGTMELSDLEIFKGSLRVLLHDGGSIVGGEVREVLGATNGDGSATVGDDQGRGGSSKEAGNRDDRELHLDRVESR